MIKPLSTVLSSDVDKSQQHQEKNSRECRESNSHCWMRSSLLGVISLHAGFDCCRYRCVDCQAIADGKPVKKKSRKIFKCPKIPEDSVQGSETGSQVNKIDVLLTMSS